MNYNVWFVVRNGSVSLNLLIPHYGYVASLTCFYWFWYMFVPVFLSNYTPVSLHMLKCSCAHTVSCLFMYCSFASIGHADIIWSIVSSNCWHSRHYYYYYIILYNIIYWNRFECAVGGVRHPQHTQTGSNSSTIPADSSNGVTNTRCCR